MKSIFIYLKGTIDFGLWYPKGNELTMVSYTYAYCEGSIDDKTSTSGPNLYLGDCLVSSLRKNKYLISLSTTKLEYITATTYFTHILWMKQTLQDI